MKKYIYIILFLPIFVSGQNNFFWSYSSGQEPSVVTNTAYAITTSTATAGGFVYKDYGLSVTARGTIWKAWSAPTILSYDGITSDGTGTGTFVSYLTGLTNSTTYYYRAYATNLIGTGYGDTYTFVTGSTSNIPSLSTTTATSITANSASSGGSGLSDNGASITSKGVVWKQGSVPTISDYDGITSDGTGTTTFVSSIIGLSGNTEYTYRAYATNSVGTGYGETKTFSTLDVRNFTLTYNDVSPDISGLAHQPVAVHFNPTGTKCYITNSTAITYQYSLTTAWDISSLTYDDVFHDPTDEFNCLTSELSENGSYLYTANTPQSRVNQYTLSTAWDLSTAATTYTNQQSIPYAVSSMVVFNGGSELGYGRFTTPNYASIYPLSTAYDISTRSSTASSNGDIASYSFSFNSDGSYFYTTINSSNTIVESVLTTSYDISTNTEPQYGYVINRDDLLGRHIEVTKSGEKLYYIGHDFLIYEFDITH